MTAPPIDSSAAQPGEHPRLDALLAEWVEWQHTGSLAHLDTRTSTFWSSGCSDFDSMVDACDTRDANVVDTLLWDMPVLERTAIHCVHLAAVWRFHREPIESVYLRARLTLSAALVRRRVP